MMRDTVGFVGAYRRAGVVTLLAAATLIGAGCGANLPTLPLVTISPTAASLQAGGGTQQFQATVVNASNLHVTWRVNGVYGGNGTVGAIDQNGLYHAPMSVPTVPIEVEAVSDANSQVQAVAKVTLSPSTTVTISPTTASVSAGATLQFSATVGNNTNTGVTWAVNGTTGGDATNGTISATGLYTAPTTFPGTAQISVTATSVADPTISATATVTLVQPVTISLSPTSATVGVGQTQAFTATVAGSSNTGVSWAVNGVANGNSTVGTISNAGLYTAPAALPSPATVTVTATSAADNTKSASAKVTLTAPVAVTITPTSATLKPGDTTQFQATVANATNTAVTWSVNGTTGGSASLGTIDAGGLYTAPATIANTSTVTVTATSVTDPTKSASATVTLEPAVSVTVTPATVTVNLGASQTFAAAVSGATNTAVTWSVNGVNGGNATLGTIDATGVFTAPTTMPANATETVTATSQADTTKSASAQVTLQVPPAQFTLSPTSAPMSLAKVASGTATFQLALSPGFTPTVTFAVAGLPPNVTATVSPKSTTASGPVTVTLTTASISLAAANLPVTLTATATPTGGPTLTQTATVLLTITGWAGHVATVAGGPGGVGFEDGGGIADELMPTAVVSDGNGTLYFADKRGTALRSLDQSTQTVTTLYGGPYNYSLAEGDGMAYDPASHTVYVADALRNRIIAYVAGGSTYRVLAGSDTPGDADGTGAAASFDWPHGLALSPDGSTLYVADTNNEQIRAVDVATGTVTTLAGQKGIYRSTDGVGTGATFCQPTGLAVDPSGADLYVSDQCGYVIRQIALPSATVTTVAGTGAQGETDGPAASATFDGQLAGLATDPHTGAHIVYIVDNNEIRALTLGSNPTVYTVAGSAAAGQSDGAGANAEFYQPNGLASVADLVGANTTTLFVADTMNGLLRQIDIQNPLTATSAATVQDTVSTIAGQPSHRGNTDGPGTGTDFSGTSTATFSMPEGIVTDGKIAYVADAYNGAVRKIDLATHTVTTVAGPHEGYLDGPAAQAAFYHDAGIAWVPSQNVLYVADTGNAVIRKIDLSTNTVSTIAGSNTAAGFVDGPGTTARFNHPFGILASPDGTKLYIADTGNNAIRMIDLSTDTVSTIAGNGGLGSNDGTGSAARFAEPDGLAFDSTGQNLYISDFENQAIRELNLATGAVTTILGAAHTCGYTDGPAATATICNPALLATDGRSLFWGDLTTGLLRVLNLSTMQVSTLAGSPGLLHMHDGDFTESPGELTGPVRYNGVFGIAIAPDDSFILFTDKDANVVREIY